MLFLKKRCKLKNTEKLHLGCGGNYFEEWVNIDNNKNFKADLYHDLRKSLPFKDNTVSFIYNEHFFEHFTVEEGLQMLRDFYRVLKPGGILRIAMPDLDEIICGYQDNNWKEQEWVKRPRYEYIQTSAEYINICFRGWDHKYLYNSEELARRLKEAGFETLNKVPFHESKYPELRHLETRKESSLIYEATK